MKRIERCQIFTPDDKANKLLDIIDYNNDLFGKKFLENSCGDGSVLRLAVSRYIKDCIKKNLSIKKIKLGLQNDIWAFEIDPAKYADCIKNLNKTADYYGINNIKWNVHETDFLKFKSIQKFSYIAGNPPYINYRELTQETREFIKENFTTCNKGKFDYCYAFIEKSLNCLDDDGKLAYLIPSSIFKNVFAENLRNFILPKISKIYDFKTEKVFSKVLVATSILVCEKNYNKTSFLYNNEENKNSFEINKNSLGKKWMFKNEKTKNNSHKVKFSDLFNAQISIATLLNNAFIFKDNGKKNGKYEVKGCDIESIVTRPAKSPRNLAYNTKERIIFPYYYNKENKLMKYQATEFEEKYPGAVQHLKTYKEALNNRNKDSSAEWFEFGRSQALSHLNQEKLLISTVVTDNIKVYELAKEDIPYAGIYITSKNGNSLNKAKQILNSDEFLNYVNNIGIQASGTSLRITPKDVNDFEFDMEAIL